MRKLLANPATGNNRQQTKVRRRLIKIPLSRTGFKTVLVLDFPKEAYAAPKASFMK